MANQLPDTGIGSSFEQSVAAVREGADPGEHARRLFEQLTLHERLGLLDGDTTFEAGLKDTIRSGYNHEPYVAGSVKRLGIPGIRFSDGPRGIVVGKSTAFPVAISRAATFDVDLEEEIGVAIGREGRAQGANVFAGICVNLLRHPGWGRAQESYGEDPVVLGEMGAALTRGVRTELMACVKHFALNSMENARFRVDVTVDEKSLHEVYLPHFKRVIDEGAESVMSAYNSVNGEWAGDSPTLLTEILRTEWGFDGYVMSDFVWGTRDPVGSVGAGLDLEMPFRQQRARTLEAAVAGGTLGEAEVQVAGERLLRAQLVWAAEHDDAPPSMEVVASSRHIALARRAAAQGIVLLRNEPIRDDGTPALPFDAAVRSVAVVGPLADKPNEGDSGSSSVRAPYSTSILAGLQARPGLDVQFEGRRISRMIDIAARSDAAVVVVGLRPGDEGESFVATDKDALSLVPGAMGWPITGSLLRGLRRFLTRVGAPVGGDRTRLGLRESDIAMVKAVAAVNERTVVVVIGGSAVTLEEIRHDVPALMLAWYPGMEGGNAIGDVLFGASEPEGRLPFVLPTTSAQLPHWEPDGDRETYDGWWGYRRLDRDESEAAYPFGFGLGYGRHTITSIDIDRPDDAVVATVEVANDVAFDSSTVIQIYARPLRPGPEDYAQQLIGFAKVRTEAGESQSVTIECGLQPLRHRTAPNEWHLASGEYEILAAQSSHDPEAVATRLWI